MGLFSKYVIWIEFKDGDEGYFYKIKDGKIFYTYNKYEAKIYNSSFSASSGLGELSAEININRIDTIDQIKIKKL